MNDIAYIYDGSLQGLLTCVFRAFEMREDPAEIRADDITLFRCVTVQTDESKAERVKKRLIGSFGRDFTETLTLVYLSGETGAETDILRYVRMAFAQGEKVGRDLCDPLVYKITKLARAVSREAHRIIEFLRFSDNNGTLVSVINPKYFILPLIAKHFERRFPNENYFIYDEVHGSALSHEKGKKSELFPVSAFTAAEPTEEERKFRRLWKLFYDTIEIKERHNPKLRVQHLPKRFWKNVTELVGEL